MPDDTDRAQRGEVTVTRAAQIAGVSVEQVRRWIAAGEVRMTKGPRWFGQQTWLVEASSLPMPKPTTDTPRERSGQGQQLSEEEGVQGGSATGDQRESVRQALAASPGGLTRKDLRAAAKRDGVRRAGLNHTLQQLVAEGEIAFRENRYFVADRSNIGELLSLLEPDISTGMDTDIGFRSIEAARALSRIGVSAVPRLVSELRRSSYAHYALGMIGGEEAFEALLAELRADNWRRVAAGARALGRIGDSRALQFLKPHAETASAEVYQAVTTAMAAIERRQIGERDWLHVDAKDPHGQVQRVFRQLRQIGEDQLTRDHAVQWHRAFVRRMSEFHFESDEQEGETWEMLGTLIYYLLNPSHTSFHAKCPEAAHCYEQALKVAPDRSLAQSTLQRVR